MNDHELVDAAAADNLQPGQQQHCQLPAQQEKEDPWTAVRHLNSRAPLADLIPKPNHNANRHPKFVFTKPNPTPIVLSAGRGTLGGGTSTMPKEAVQSMSRFGFCQPMPSGQSRSDAQQGTSSVTSRSVPAGTPLAPAAAVSAALGKAAASVPAAQATSAPVKAPPYTAAVAAQPQQQYGHLPYTVRHALISALSEPQQQLQQMPPRSQQQHLQEPHSLHPAAAHQ
jgi:hypothetical protein